LLSNILAQSKRLEDIDAQNKRLEDIIESLLFKNKLMSSRLQLANSQLQQEQEEEQGQQQEAMAI
jgi:hypothetical protein